MYVNSHVTLPSSWTLRSSPTCIIPTCCYFVDCLRHKGSVFHFPADNNHMKNSGKFAFSVPMCVCLAFVVVTSFTTFEKMRYVIT